MRSITGFVNSWPYFGTGTLVLMMWVAGAILFRRQGRASLLSGLMALPFGLWALALVPDYWIPRSLFSMGRVGLEDFMWALGTGGLVWLLAVIPVREPPRLKVSFPATGIRFLTIAGIGIGIFLPLWLLGVEVMMSFVIGVVGLGVVLCVVRPELWKLAVSGALGFGLANILLTKSAVAFCPDYFLQMTPGALSGQTIVGLPVEEFYWAFATVAVWPLAVCFVFRVNNERL